VNSLIPVSTKFQTIAISTIIAIVVFIFDLIAPLGIAGGVPFVLFVLSGLWFRKRSAILYLAIFASILTILGYYFSPPGGIGWVVLTNRSYALVAIWAVAIALWWNWHKKFSPDLLENDARQNQLKPMLAYQEGVFVSVMVILIIVSTILVIYKIEAEARNDVSKSLNTSLESAHLGINKQLELHKNTATIWANNANIIAATKELLGVSVDVKSLVAHSVQLKLRTFLEPLLNTFGYRGFFIINKEDVNLASFRDVNIGLVNLLSKQGKFLEQIRSGRSLISLPQTSDTPLKDINGEIIENLPTMFVASPIKNEEGSIIAVLAFRLEPDESFTPVFEASRFGESGETYAFDNKGLMISESRFNEQLKQIGLINHRHSDLSIEIRDPMVNMLLGEKPSLPRNELPLTRMVKSAIAGERGSDFDGYNDYRGVPVVGAWLWDDKLSFGSGGYGLFCWWMCCLSGLGIPI